MRSRVAGLSATAFLLCACTTAGSAVPNHPAAHTHADRTADSAARTSPPPRPTKSPARASTTPPSTQPFAPQTSAQAEVIGPARRIFRHMTQAQRVGQLFMVDCPTSGIRSATVTAIRRNHVGSVILDGNSTLGVRATRQITDKLQAIAPDRVKLFISTDQEGGLVQRLRGPGFSSIPSAVQQGRMRPPRLRSDAAIWGRQLRAAGVNVDLAPVLDTVPANSPGNPPIGDLDREYGHRPVVVARHGVAFALGLADARVDATGKHFPGLGRVAENTDSSSGVTDTVTTRHDRYLRPFAAAANHHVPFIMMSTAIYKRIDPGRPAAFSRTIVTGMLRGDLGFKGVIISDDISAAEQVSGYPAGRRAVNFVAAGGDIVLAVDPSVIAPMAKALLVRAQRHPAFRAKINAAALTVLQAKRARGLLHHP
jgi:beta-N-acetylhexosaminidase